MAFLSAANANVSNSDDDLAVAPMADLGMNVSTVSWDEDRSWREFDVVIVRSTWDYHDRSEAFFRALSGIDKQTRVANPLETMRWNARKNYLADLRERGVETVDTQFGDALDTAALDALCDRFATSEWILKPQIGANSSGVHRLRSADLNEVRGSTRTALLDEFSARPFMAQPFLPAVLDPGEYSVFFFAGRYSHTILKTPTSGDFRVQEDYGSHIREVAPSEALMSAAHQTLCALPERCLYVRVDLIEQSRGSYALMEVELIEPSLYLRTCGQAPQNFADAVARWLSDRTIGEAD
ncbi:MAG: hypothetical protein AAF610_04665 [Pseudomonadota bacterium]